MIQKLLWIFSSILFVQGCKTCRPGQFLDECNTEDYYIQFINIATGKSLSEVLIYSSINPQYDNRLFNDLGVQLENHKSRTFQGHVVYTNYLDVVGLKYRDLHPQKSIKMHNF